MTDKSPRPGERDEHTREVSPSNPRNWRRRLKNLIAFVIISGFLGYLWTHRHELERAFDASLWHFVAISILILFSWALNGLQAFVVYRAVGVQVTVSEGILLTVAGTFGNYLPMRAGTILRALYLKEVHGLRIARFGGITALRTLLTIIAAGLVGLFALGHSWLEVGSLWTPELATVFVLLVAGPIGLMLVPSPRFSWLPSRIRALVGDIASAYEELRRKPAIAILVVALLVAQYLTLGLRFVISADALGANMPLGFLFLMAPLAALMSYAAITPGGLGLREAVMGYVSLNVGYSFSEGVFVGTVDRAILLGMVAIFGSISFLLLWRRTHAGAQTKNSVQRSASG